MKAQRAGRCLSACSAVFCLSACVSFVSGVEPTTSIQFDTESTDVCLPDADEAACEALLGGMRFTGGLDVRANSAHVGGLSSLLVSFDALRFGSVTDAGWLVTGELQWRNGWLEGLGNGKIGPLLALDGRSLGDRADPTTDEIWDAESLAAVNTTHPLQGDLLVSFERQHRVWRYQFGAEGHRAIPTTVAGLSGHESATAACPHNGGAEAMEMLRDGSIMVICEEEVETELQHPAGHAEEQQARVVLGWVVAQDGATQQLRYLIRDGLEPVALARVPGSDDLVVLERKWAPAEGNSVRLRHITARSLLASLASGCTINASLLAQLNPSLHNVDNFEGLAIIPRFPRARPRILSHAEGEDRMAEEREAEGLEILMVADNNFAPSQRTLLMSFHLNRTLLPASSCLPAPASP